jgi:hypothetical protein
MERYSLFLVDAITFGKLCRVFSAAIYHPAAGG